MGIIPKSMEVTFRLEDGTTICITEMDSHPGLDVAFTHEGKYYKVVSIDENGICTVKEADPQSGRIT